MILLREGFPVNVLNPLKAVPEVCTIFCATANPVDVLVAVTNRGRGIIGVIDGSPPIGIEQDTDVADRRTGLMAEGQVGGYSDQYGPAYIELLRPDGRLVQIAYARMGGEIWLHAAYRLREMTVGPLYDMPCDILAVTGQSGRSRCPASRRRAAGVTCWRGGLSGLPGGAPPRIQRSPGLRVLGT